MNDREFRNGDHVLSTSPEPELKGRHFIVSKVSDACVLAVMDGEHFPRTLWKKNLVIVSEVPPHLKYVYVAGPMSKGDLIGHVRMALSVGDRIIEVGGVPYLPQLSILWEIASPKAYEHWMELDFAWIDRCDCIVRIPGESAGADREAIHARKQDKPVFLGVEEYVKALRSYRTAAVTE